MQFDGTIFLVFLGINCVSLSQVLHKQVSPRNEFILGFLLSVDVNKKTKNTFLIAGELLTK